MTIRAWVLNNLGLKLLSVILAVLLWAVVLGEQKVEVTVSISLEIKDLPRNMVLVNEPTDTLHVRLRGPRTLVTTLGPREVAFAGLPKTFVEGENLVPIRPGAVQVPRGIQVVEVNPTRLRVVLDAIVEREIEVSPRVEGNPARGFVVKRVTSSPARIRMTGPKTELRRLAKVYTLPINLEGHSTSFTTRAMLEPPGRQIRTVEETPIIVGVEIASRKS